MRSPKTERTRTELEEENTMLRAAVRDLRDHLGRGEELLEAQNGQLALQNLYVERNRRQLHHQEKKKKKNATDAILNTDMGRIFTSDEFRAALVEDEARLAEKESAAETRAAKAQWKAAEKRRVEIEWVLTRNSWQSKKSQMQADGKKSGWGRCPKKPKRAPTPDYFQVPSGAGNNGGEDERSVPDGDNEDSESEEEDDEEAI